MIALTSRLNERDERINQLEEELDAFDRIHREAEQIIEYKKDRIQQLEEYIINECKEVVPSDPFEDDDQVR
jgi:kinesin family protein 3/17